MLDIQGSVEEHLAVLRRLGVKTVAVKSRADLDKVAGLIIPGGESTTVGKLLKLYGLDKAIRNRTLIPHPSSLYPCISIWGTCAGAILLAKKVTGGKPEGLLGLMDIEISRNAYGRQLDSFETEISIPCVGNKKFPAIFIRAPQVEMASKKAKVLAQYEGRSVMLQQENLLITTFHPELTRDTRVHKYFISMVQRYASKKTKS